MNQFDSYAIIGLFFVGVVILFMIIYDMALADDMNAFLNKWAKKTLWIWLPFYALQRLIREVLLKKKIKK